ncbi:MAG: hypothetical protein A2W90_11680 [Bacteroidetes bacterium GWF2_42_66]|nr:MAG: hypothetical protein A2W92_00375 [Bacteroidetes bacterium GWA2_42_15]OFY01769.1 MAG: hypothetical protein A2W89_22890 [Bacteroidetes bacterium GWE2_42_39]OFY44939.1 MAG: hypothetical protein A2W90_11680 [Bacteroidetes bacterium GWF2_42_66]HBL76069.1 DUF4395 domain-containing protein [Prolixibacteraceae bacterium]HCR90213.1 DUF4395 domain-containing protein [Prolixibacteraceae bacterium]
MKNILCPISDERINEQVTRLNALFAIVTVVLAFVSKSPVFLIFLMADFFMRAFTRLKYSPISYMSVGLSNALQLPAKSIDKAPKIFAARLGFVMTTVISLLFILNLKLAALVVAGVLVFFATLEFAFAICVGCAIYSYFVLPFYKK